MTIKLLFLSSLNLQCGNCSTSNRISTYLVNHGFSCEVLDPESFTSSIALNNYIDSNHIQCVLGIHLYKSGHLLKDCKKPYIIIVGGTDVNRYHTDIQTLHLMTQAVHNSSYVVVFGDSLKKRVNHLWADIPSEKIVEIKQAVITNPSSFCLYKYLHTEGYIDVTIRSRSDVKLFLVISGIRQVKDPLYLVTHMSHWHCEDESIYYVIIGPKIEEGYYREFLSTIKSLRGVIYIPGLSVEDTHAAIKQADVVVNSSKSEGMSLAILEAMNLGTPVICRNISGNRDVIQHNITGLLFNTPQEFIREAKILLSSPKTRDSIVEGARHYISQHHSSQMEEEKYCTLIKNCTV